MTRNLHTSLSIEEAVELGQVIGLQSDVSVHTTEQGVAVGDTNIVPPQSLDQYLGRLCTADSKPYFVPSQSVRDALVLSLGYAYSTKMQQPVKPETEYAHG